MTTSTPVAGALDRILDPLSRSLDPHAARSLVDFRIDAEVQERMAALAERCTEGVLTDEERSEYQAYVEGIGLVNILRSKALHVLASAPES